MTTDQDIYTENLLRELWRVQTSFVTEDQKVWGAQKRMADALGMSKPTLNAILQGKRPGTGKGSDGRTFMEKAFHYAHREGDDALIRALIAYAFKHPAYLPSELELDSQ